VFPKRAGSRVIVRWCELFQTIVRVILLATCPHYESILFGRRSGECCKSAAAKHLLFKLEQKKIPFFFSQAPWSRGASPLPRRRSPTRRGRAACARTTPLLSPQLPRRGSLLPDHPGPGTRTRGSRPRGRGHAATRAATEPCAADP
jgi:hypothetical protein